MIGLCVTANNHRLLLLFVSLLLLLCFTKSDEDFYAMLGVDKDADVRTIRRAFKKIAIAKHPDKNTADPNAHSEFVRINRAYEVLKDEELRKKYDLHGEAGLKDDFHGGQQYQSWQFYRDNFGIYDDDPEIVTLNRGDFQQAVTDSGDRWFVNFYSTYCSHCHTLAPAWRKLSRELEGSIRFGAVNCAEDPMLCQSQRVMGYPSLVMYPEGTFYYGNREVDDMITFAMNFVTASVHKITTKNLVALTVEWDDYSSKPWLVDFCDVDSTSCLSTVNRKKLAAMLEGLVNVGTVLCGGSDSGGRSVDDGEDESKKATDLCDQLGKHDGVAFYPAREMDKKHGEELDSLDPKELATKVLSFLPDPELITEEKFWEMQEQVANGDKLPTLVQFMGDAGDDAHPDLELKKLPAMLPEIELARVDCSTESNLCTSKLHFKKFPAFVMLKATGGYEIHYGRTSAHDVVTFARDGADADMQALDHAGFADAISDTQDGSIIWIVDFFAPWCPPCMRLLPELRKTALALGGTVRVGTVDCTVYLTACQSAGVNSYPTTIIYHNGKPNPNIGWHSTEQILEFIEDVQSPAVQALSPEDVRSLVNNRNTGKMWVLDFFAPWCGPCQQLAPEFRKVARILQKDPKITSGSVDISLGSIDCQQHSQFCTTFGITGFPTIRLFQSDTKQPHIDYPSNFWRDSGSILRWVQEHMPSKVAKLGHEFYSTVLEAEEPWLVDFFAPWCGHCVQFAPVFEQIAESLEGRVRLGKVDCDRSPDVCRSASVRAYPTIRLYTGVNPENGLSQNPDGIDINSQSAQPIIEMVELHLKHKEQRRKKAVEHDEF